MAPPSPPPTSTYMHQALHTTPTLTNLLLSSSNLVRSPYMHKVPQAVQFRYAALTFILAPGYVQIITLEASQPRDRLTSAAFRSVTSVIIFCLVPSMKTFTAGVSKGGVQKFNGHLYWFSWQVNNSHSFQKSIYFFCAGQRCQCEERQVGLVQRQELLQVQLKPHICLKDC